MAGREVDRKAAVFMFYWTSESGTHKMMVMRLFFLLFLFCAGVFEIKAQTALDWGHPFGNADSTLVLGIAVDGMGNVYSVGSFSGTVDFDPGPGIADLTSAGDLDVFIVKLDSLGNYIWAKSLGGADEDQGNAIALDLLGNVYIAGYFYGLADFDPNSGTNNLLSSGGADAFICKLDANGIFMWAAKAGGMEDDEAKTVAVDANGDVLFAGFFHGLANFNPGPGVTTLTSAGGEDAFITKLDAGGIFVWTTGFGGANDDAILDLTLDADDNVITTGFFSGTVDFDPGAGNADLTAGGMNDVFVSKLNVFAHLVWAKNFGGANNDEGLGIHADMAGNVYTTGYFNSTADFDPGPGADVLTSAGMEDIFISKLNVDGDYVWAKRFGSTGVDQAHDVTTDLNGDVYTIGYFSESVDFDPGDGNATLTSFGLFNTFISRLTAMGDFVFASEFAGTDEVKGLTIAVDSTYHIYCGGEFKGDVDVDPGLGGLVLTSTGDEDAFVVKLKPCLPTSAEINVEACESYDAPSGGTTWTESGTYQDKIVNAAGCDSLITINLTIHHRSESEITVTGLRCLPVTGRKHLDSVRNICGYHSQCSRL